MSTFYHPWAALFLTKITKAALILTNYKIVLSFESHLTEWLENRMRRATIVRLLFVRITSILCMSTNLFSGFGPNT